VNFAEDLRRERERVFLAMSPERQDLAIAGLERMAARHPDSEGIADTLKLARGLRKRLREDS
jgi:hypothetical protein